MVMFMKEEGTIKQQKQKKASSNKQKKYTKKVEEIDSSLLLDEILAKKKSKKSKKSKTTTSSNKNNSINKKNTIKGPQNKKVKEEEKIDNSALLDEILAKKKAKKDRATQSKKGLLVDNSEVNNNVVAGIIKEKEKVSAKIVSSAPDYSKCVKKNILSNVNDDKENEKVNITLEDKKESRTSDVKKSFKNSKKKYLLFMTSVIIVFFVAFICGSFKYKLKKEEQTVFKDNTEELERQAKALEIKHQQEYDECLNLSFNDNDNSSELNDYINELNTYLSNYSVSLIYEDLERGFTFSYNQDAVYYAASTIKSLDALYIYQKAYNNELSLDETMTYTANFKWGSSKYMSTHQYGDQITLRDLVKYAIMVSDNSAHQMLVKYIGYSNLKAFGQSLGAQYTLTSGDNFGNLSANDGIIYMKAIYNFINQSGELGQELKSYFVQAEQNDLEFPDLQIQAAHKYGQYSEFYHDIGIVYDEHPYVIAILTREGKKDFESIVKDINSHLYKLHTLYIENRQNYCHTLAYGK